MDKLCWCMGYRYSPTIGNMGLTIMIHYHWADTNHNPLWSKRIRGYLVSPGYLNG